MNDVRQILTQLQEKGWTVAAISDEVGVRATTVHRWRSGERYPENAKMVLAGLDALLRRRRVPKQRRYAPGARRRPPAQGEGPGT